MYLMTGLAGLESLPPGMAPVASNNDNNNKSWEWFWDGVDWVKVQARKHPGLVAEILRALGLIDKKPALLPSGTPPGYHPTGITIPVWALVGGGLVLLYLLVGRK